MNARRIGAAIGAVTLVASGSYVFVYLYRWEWNRALISGVFFLAAELALATLLLASRMQRMAADTAAVRDEVRQQRVLHHLRANAPAPRDHFAWVNRSGQLNVFVPVLLGAGVLLSGLAWCVERLGRLTAGPTMERGLARQLSTLAPASGGFVPAGSGADPAVELLRRPVHPELVPASHSPATSTAVERRPHVAPAPASHSSAGGPGSGGGRRLDPAPAAPDVASIAAMSVPGAPGPVIGGPSTAAITAGPGR